MNRRVLFLIALSWAVLPLHAGEETGKYMLRKELENGKYIYTWSNFLKDSPDDPLYWPSVESALIIKYGSLKNRPKFNFPPPDKIGWSKSVSK